MRKIEIIAEIGINHQGDMGLAREMIHAAKRAGADTAKFQYYNPKKVLNPEHPLLKPWWNLILATQLSPDDVYMLQDTCREVGIAFLCSVFDPADVLMFQELAMERYKIASRSMYDRALALAIAATGKPVLVSYGCQNSGRVASVFRLPGCGLRSISRLYCVAKYPTPIEDIRFAEVDSDGEPYGIFDLGLYDGFSDHTIGITAAVVAMALGAKIIEKHFTMDRDMPGPDHKCSATSDELAQLCKMRDDIERMEL